MRGNGAAQTSGEDGFALGAVVCLILCVESLPLFLYFVLWHAIVAAGSKRQVAAAAAAATAALVSEADQHNAYRCHNDRFQ